MARLTGLIAPAILALACTPFGAWAQGSGDIFVSLERGNEIVVLNSDYEIIDRIETSRRPRDMHFNADKTLLYVAAGDDDVIDVIDVATHELVDNIPTGPSPEVFTFSPDGTQIYVSNEEDSTLEYIDLATGTVTNRVPTGAEPEGVINGVNGEVIYVTSEVADMVHVVDRASARVVKNIIVGTRPRRFVTTPDGAELWVSDELSSEVHVIDTETNEIKEVLTFLPPGFRPEDVTPVGMTITEDGSRILISLGRANHVAVVDAATREVEAYILVGSRAWSVALSHDETKAYVANGLSDDITVIDMERLRPVTSIPVGRTPHTIVVDD
ncbi:PQQ-dependent catabolism-associated beta-propeller protein [Pseudoroseicyclus sp. H15]